MFKTAPKLFAINEDTAAPSTPINGIRHIFKIRLIIKTIKYIKK
jgi:hypothetical protein